MPVKSILIIRCGALGDLVYATSIIDALKKEYGKNTIIDFVCASGIGTIFNKDDRVNKVFSIKHNKIPIFFNRNKKDIIKHSQKNNYDILINFEFGKQFFPLIKKIKAKKKTGALIDKSIIPSDIVHMVDVSKYIFKDIVSLKVYKESFPKLVGTNKTEVQKKYQLTKKYIIISPSNSHQKRNILNYRAWENTKWIELIAKLSKEIQIVIVGNNNEDDFFNKIKPYPNNVIDLVAKTSLPDLIGVIESASGLVATDTGTAHMASAVNTEVFTLIGPTPAEVTGPYQSPTNKVHIISSNLECAPCYKTEVMKNCKDNLCMKEISTKMVYDCIKSANLL